MTLHQIPAKAYEYIRTGKPVLALTPAEGDTGSLLAEAGVADICPLEDKDKIKSGLLAFLARLREGNVHTLSPERLAVYSRQHQSEVFQELLESAL